MLFFCLKGLKILNVTITPDLDKAAFHELLAQRRLSTYNNCMSDKTIIDFLYEYAKKPPVSFHMPGHKGASHLGMEALDITEITGADVLYHAQGIIAGSEANAAALFGSARTLYSTEGSSQCIRAMVFLTLTCRKQGAAPVILAARNSHKAFLYALALTGAEVEWLWGEDPSSLCSCRISPAMLENALCAMQAPPAAVWA